jgi:two-component system, NarL family, sensor histidine kinase DesK
MSQASGPLVTSDEGADRRWWIGLVFSGFWLVFLQQPFQEAWTHLDSPRGVLGLASLVGFCALYLVSFPRVRRLRLRDGVIRRPGEAALVVGGLSLLAALSCWSVGQSGTATLVFLAVCTMQWLPTRLAVGFVAGMLAAFEVLVRVVPGWTEDPSLSFAVATASLAMFGFIQLLNRNVELVRAKEQNARLAVADERNRFARDLHDILGHSLTVITVKAELAGRLLDDDPERARAELDDIERLSRDALADVRRAVGGYRELSLAGELASARTALQAAGIRAELPSSVDDVPTEARELFAWTVREGVTNVIRHSGATRCTVALAASGVRIEDDGPGPGPGAGSGIATGHGLAGLRERAVAAGAVLVTTVLDPGFRLEVTLP